MTVNNRVRILAVIVSLLILIGFPAMYCRVLGAPGKGTGVTIKNIKNYTQICAALCCNSFLTATVLILGIKNN